MIQNGPKKLENSDPEKFYPTALILTPTRELSIQIHKEAERFCYCTGIAPSVVYGGIPIQESLHSLRTGCDILVGTPGRVSDLIDRDVLGLEAVS